MNNFILAFIVGVLVVVGVVFNYDFSQAKTKDEVVKKEVKKEEVKKDVKIVYEKEKPKEVIKEKDVKKAFEKYVKDNTKEMHTLSKKKVGKYTVALKTVAKPEQNKFAPPQFPTMIKGEIDGNKYNLVLPEEAKKQGVVFTVTSATTGTTAVIDVPVLQDTTAGTLVDMGNINPPEEITEENVEEFEQEVASEIEESVEESQNQSEGTTSIAPPSPPAVQ